MLREYQRSCRDDSRYQGGTSAIIKGCHLRFRVLISAWGLTPFYRDSIINCCGRKILGSPWADQNFYNATPGLTSFAEASTGPVLHQLNVRARICMHSEVSLGLVLGAAR